MAVTRTARGTASSKTSGTTLTIASQSLNARDLLVVYLAYDDVSMASVFWGTQEMTLGPSALGAGVRTRMAWCVADATATRSIVATWDTALVAKAMVADSFRSSVTTAGFSWNEDAGAENVGLGTAASTAATAAIVGGTESVRVGVVGTEGPSGDTAGTWVAPSVAGQRIGTTGNPAAGNVTASSAYNVAPAAGSTTALSKTGMTSRDWGAAIRSFYWAAPPIPPVNLAGQADGSSSGVAALEEAIPLNGQADGSSSGTAELLVEEEVLPVELAGTATGSSSGVAAIAQGIPLQANADGSSSGVASVSVGIPLQAAADGTSSGVSAIDVGIPLLAFADGSSAGAASLELSIPLSGAADGTSAGTASLQAELPVVELFAAADGSSSGSASLDLALELGGEATGVSSGQAALEQAIELAAAADGSSSGAASLELSLEIFGSADGSSEGVASLLIEGEAALAGTADGSSSAIASLAIEIELFGSADGSSAGSALLEAAEPGAEPVELAGSAAGSSAAEAALFLEISLFATAEGSSSAIVRFAVGFGMLEAGLPSAVGMEGGPVSTAGTVISRAEGPRISSHAEPG